MYSWEAMSSVSMGKGRWFDSGGVACDTVGRDRVSSLVSSLGRIDLGAGCARGVAAKLSLAPWWHGIRLLSLTSIASGSPCS